MSLDLQDRVDDWHRETFGQDVPMERLVAKLSEEVHEFICAFLCGKSLVEQAKELADVQIVLYAIAGRRETELDWHTNEKLGELIARGKSQIARDIARGIPSNLPSDIEAGGDRG